MEEKETPCRVSPSLHFLCPRPMKDKRDDQDWGFKVKKRTAQLSVHLKRVPHLHASTLYSSVVVLLFAHRLTGLNTSLCSDYFALGLVPPCHVSPSLHPPRAQGP